MAEPILSFSGVSIAFDTRAGLTEVVSDTSFDLRAGETLGLVGESGSGKTMVGLAAMGLVPHPGRVTRGSIRLDGVDLLTLDEPRLRALRGSAIAMVLQDPLSSLNPTLTIGTQLVEAVRAHDAVGADEAKSRAREALARVGIARPDAGLAAYPHQFSTSPTASRT